MSSGLQRRRVGGGGDNTLSPSTSRPDLSNSNSFSGRSSPVIPSHSTEGINSIEQQTSDHRIAFDPRDMEEGEERLKFPKLTLMEEVLLLGLKDKQVTSGKLSSLMVRDTCHFGMIIFRILYEDVFYWNWLFDRGYRCKKILHDDGLNWQTDLSKSLMID